MDLTLFLYGTHFAVDIVGFLLMTWWLFTLYTNSKKISIFYICIWLMFLGGSIMETGNMIARWHCISGNAESLRTILMSDWWPIRVMLNTVADAVVVTVLIKRYFFLKE